MNEVGDPCLLMRVVETNFPIDQDDLSEFVCRKCASELDKYARKVACTVIVS